MSVATDVPIETEPDGVDPDVGTSRRLTVVLTSVIAVAVLVVAVAAGFFWGNRSDNASATMPSASSVDAGFARDMSTHHRQALTMASYTMTNSTDPAIKLLAYDIDATQSGQLGEMQGWLDSWGLPTTASTRMAWMGAQMAMPSTELMPGMATPTQITELQAAKGKALDVLFLQLMLRHHQGGLEMANYAAQHASEPYVRALAANMATTQANEITQMEQLLRARGASPLPPPN